MLFHKYTGNPILDPRKEGWQSRAIFNPAAWTDGTTISLLYRTEDAIQLPDRPFASHIGLATSTDGLRFQQTHDIVLTPTEPYEIPGGCEDPRLTRIDKTFYLTYTAYDGKTARLAMATSSDLITWNKQGPLFPERGWTKSGAILSQPLEGKYWMYFGDTSIWSAHSTDLLHWTVIDEPVLSPRESLFDSKLVEPGPPPLLTPQGILFIYNSADHDLRYATGWCIFDQENPRRVIMRSDHPFLEPETPEEIQGRVPNVVFAEGLVFFNDRWFLYYGMADSYIGVAISESETLAF